VCERERERERDTNTKIKYSRQESNDYGFAIVFKPFDI
jgi:hypothetical protein